MSDRPIIFSAPMVQALLAGRKTQTRRIIKPQPVWNSSCGDRDGFWSGDAFMRVSSRLAIGDRLWVREACWSDYQGPEGNGVRYAADGAWIAIKGTPDAAAAWYKLDYYANSRHPDNATNTGQKVPSIHMPRWASRLTLTVTDVRMRRLQEITDADAEAEGATGRPGGYDLPDWCMDWSRIGQHSRTMGRPLTQSDIAGGSPIWAYASYWNTLHGPGAWDANPWIVALTFAVARGNIDA